MQGSLVITEGRGGWVQVWAEALPGPFFVRFAPGETGRLDLVELYLGAAQVDTKLIRQLPLGAVEKFVNEPETRRRLEAKAKVPGPDLSTIAAGFPKERPAVSQRRPLQVVVEPAGRGGAYSDDFYRGVAELYNDVSRWSERPAVDIAEACVPPAKVTTVHRWIKEARKRGHLPPGRKGKAG